MNRSRARELLPIIQAFAEGRDIEWKVPTGDWKLAKQVSALSFYSHYEYRIKPEPREFWLSMDGDKVRYGLNEEELKSWNTTGATQHFIKVREVIE